MSSSISSLDSLNRYGLVHRIMSFRALLNYSDCFFDRNETHQLIQHVLLRMERNAQNAPLREHYHSDAIECLFPFNIRLKAYSPILRESALSIVSYSNSFSICL